jgi:hypothetical protein
MPFERALRYIAIADLFNSSLFIINMPTYAYMSIDTTKAN